MKFNKSKAGTRSSAVRFVIVSCLVTAIAACANVGGGTAETRQPASSTLDFPVDAALTRFFSTDATYNASTSFGGDKYDLHLRVKPSPDESLPDISPTPLKTTRQIVVTAVNSSEYETTAAEKIFYSTSPFTLWVEQDDMGELGVMIDIFQERTGAPITAKVGQFGHLATGPFSYIVDDVLVVSKQVVTWSLEPDTASTAWLCINTNAVDEDGRFSQSDCARIDSAGAISGYRAKFSNSQETIEYR